MIIEQEEFSEAIHNIITVCEQARGVEKGGSLPHFFYIKVEGLGGRLRLSANNMIRAVIIDLVKVSPHEPFCVGVSGAHLKNLVFAMPRGELNLEIRDGFWLSGGHSNYRLMTLQKDSFPTISLPENYTPANFADILGAFSRISYCVSYREMGKPYEKAICLLHDYAVCTDNHRLSYISNSFFHVDPNHPVLFPAETSRCLSLVFKKATEGFIATEKNMMHFHSGNVYVGTRLLEGKPPANLRNVLRQDSVFSPVAFSSNKLKQALKRLVSFSLSTEKTKLPFGEFEFSPQSLTVRIEINGYKAEEVIDTQGGISVKIGLNMVYVYQALKTIGDVACFEIRGPELPVVIADASSANTVRNIIMPQITRR